MQRLDVDAHPVARHSDPDTSHIAARSVLRRTANDTMRLILSVLGRYHTLTDTGLYRVVSNTIDVSESGLRTRRNELAKAGLIEDSTLRAETKHGRPCIMWRLTQHGKEIAETLPFNKNKVMLADLVNKDTTSKTESSK